MLGKSATQFERLPISFFLEVARQMPDCCEFQFALDQDRVVGFCISLNAGHSYHPMFMGLDYNVSREAGLYFNFGFRTLEDAIKAGASEIEVGQNSEEFKVTRLGAVQARRSIYVRGTGAVMNAVIGMLFKQLFPEHPLPSSNAGVKKEISREAPPSGEGKTRCSDVPLVAVFGTSALQLRIRAVNEKTLLQEDLDAQT